MGIAIGVVVTINLFGKIAGREILVGIKQAYLKYAMRTIGQKMDHVVA